MSLHIAIDDKAPVAKSVLMPGDPLRAQFIAENYLDSPVRYSEIRNMNGYTGTYKGVPVSVQEHQSWRHSRKSGCINRLQLSARLPGTGTVLSFLQL